VRQQSRIGSDAMKASHETQRVKAVIALLCTMLIWQR